MDSKSARLRVLHLGAGVNRLEGIGRSIYELARGMPDVSSHLLTDRVGASEDLFESVHEVGGSPEFFYFSQSPRIREVIKDLQPDLVHLHGSIFLPFFASTPALPGPTVMTIFAWPRVPRLNELFNSSRSELLGSAVLQPRVLASHVLPQRLLKAALKSKRVAAVITPDKKLKSILERLSSAPVALAQGGGETDGLRARFEATRPIVVFAGKAESARGIDTLLAAIPEVVHTNPATRFRFLLLPSPQLSEITHRILRHPFVSHIDLVTGAIDVRTEFASATVAAFPFKFDFVAIPPVLTVAESMSVGLPVIGTSVQCLRALVKDGFNAVVVPRNDHRSLAREILRVTRDSELWQRLSSSAVQTISSDWSWSAMAHAVRQTYDRVLRDD